MLFHTWTFALFFAVAYAVYLPLRGTRWCVPWLLATSYIFYGWWNPLYLLLILFATTLDFSVVTFMERSAHRHRWIAVSVCCNLLYLGFFKYADFVAANANALLARLGSGWTIPAPDILLPVGISFFTFQSMSYTIDFYRGKIPRERSWVRFAAFVSLFPQLVAGPIERASHLLGQLHGRRTITVGHVTDGLSLFVVGLFKKVCIADALAPYVDAVYGAPDRCAAGALALATFAFGWQIYCDFSGYTDMARGVARMMGFELMLNFRNPYLATGLGDFWGRWHISLSTWFRDYVYIPLGGNRRGRWATHRNMCLTMLLSGLWHGASWTFLLWGALHAAGRVATRELEGTRLYAERVPATLKRLGVFLFVTFTWIFFRAETARDAWTIVRRIFSEPWGDPGFPPLGYLLCFGLWGCQALHESRWRRVLEPAPVRVAAVLGMIFWLIFIPGRGAQFIYFQF